MSRSRRGYNGYKGRATATDILRVVAVILLVLVVLVGLGMLFGQKYILYTDKGLRLELPFMEREEPAQQAFPGDVTVKIEPAQSTAQPEAQPEPEQEEAIWLKAVELPLGSVLEGSVLSQLQARGANAVILDMKDDQGSLGFVSQQEQARRLGANPAETDRLNQKLTLLDKKGIYLVARVSCFRDHKLADDWDYSIETNPGRRWYDQELVRWSSPASQEVQDYLVAVMVELAQLGFDEIVLDNWGYPTSQDGHLEYIKKGDAYPVREGKLDQVTGAFLERARQAVEEEGAVLSVMGKADLLEYGQESGQTIAQVAELSGKIWCAASAVPELQERLEQAGMKDVSAHLVGIEENLSEKPEAHQAIYREK